MESDAKSRTLNKIMECSLQMNQMHGIEILNYEKNDLIVHNC
jgi:hypothetical protein